jgi:hypothetical protein
MSLSLCAYVHMQVLRDEDVTFCVFLYALRNLHVGSLYESKLPILADFLEVVIGISILAKILYVILHCYIHAQVFDLQLLYHCPDLAIYLRKK